MQAPNVELVERLYARFAAGGAEAVADSFAPDALIHPFAEWPDQDPFRGPDGLRAVLAEWTENFDEFELTVAEVRAIGDRVVVLGETVGRIRGSAVPIRQPLGSVYAEFSDGRIGLLHNFLTWDEAIDFARGS